MSEVNTAFKLAMDEDYAWNKIQEIRSRFNPDLNCFVQVRSKRDAVNRANKILNEIFTQLFQMGLPIYSIDPGHGTGHIIRDKVHSLMLAKLDLPPADIFVGVMGGVLHDIGCAIVDRYNEEQTVIRHAEAAALLMQEVFEENYFNLNEHEIVLILYTIAAHTHYLKPVEVNCSDGIARIIEPYQDKDRQGNPIWSVWMTRWVDRLDCNGPCFMPRHYLTLVKPHRDYSQHGFFDVDFASHLRPIVREKQEGSRTMLEHLKMFADSQTNDSPYGKYDFGVMIELRDKERAQLYKIIQAVLEGGKFSKIEEFAILANWENFLATNIEPNPKGVHAANQLSKMFFKLDDETRNHWLNGFRVTMKEYDFWVEDRMNFLDKCSEGWVQMEGISTDVKSVIQPSRAWYR